MRSGTWRGVLVMVLAPITMLLFVSVVLAGGPAGAASVTNGTFSARLNGWSRGTLGIGFWTALTGTVLPNGLSVPPAPNDANTAAATTQSGNGARVLYQYVALEPGYRHVLDLDYYFRSWSGAWRTPRPDTFDRAVYPNQQARIEVLASGATPWSVDADDVLATVFRTADDTPADAEDYRHARVDLTPWAGQRVLLRLADVNNMGSTTLAATNIAITSALPGEDVVTTLTSGANPSRYGEAVTLTATVAHVGGLLPTGAVRFFDGSTELGAGALVDGVATLVTDALGVGRHALRAVYGSSPPSTGELTHVVERAETHTVVSVAPSATVTWGQQQTITATVSVVAPGAGAPSGQVRFTVDLGDDGSDDATVDVELSGSVAGYAATLPPGTHRLSARYLGEAELAPSSAEETVVVTEAATSVTYQGDYLAQAVNPLTLRATVDSATAACEADRDVQFRLSAGGELKYTATARSHANGGAIATLAAGSVTAGQYDVLVVVADNGYCAAADTGGVLNVVVATGGSAHGGGWYLSPAGTHVTFEFGVRWVASEQAYDGHLLLIARDGWRLRAAIDEYGASAASGVARGAGLLYRAGCAPSCGRDEPIPVTFTIAFSDGGPGGSGRKSGSADSFALTVLSTEAGGGLVSGPRKLSAGSVTIR